MGDEPIRKVRADAARNRAKVLAAAEDHFATHGVSASLDAVARDAGVGPATLYRHFPTRDALLAGLLTSRRAELLQQQRSIDELDDPHEALQVWLLALEGYFSLYGGLAEPLAVASRDTDGHNPLTGSCQDLILATEGYLQAAQHAGRAADDLTGRDLFLAINAVAWMRSTGAADDASIARLRTRLTTGCQHP